MLASVLFGFPRIVRPICDECIERKGIFRYISQQNSSCVRNPNEPKPSAMAFALDGNGFVFRSGDKGKTWTKSNGDSDAKRVQISIAGGVIWSLDSRGAVWRSGDAGFKHTTPNREVRLISISAASADMI